MIYLLKSLVACGSFQVVVLHRAFDENRNTFYNAWENRKVFFPLTVSAPVCEIFQRLSRLLHVNSTGKNFRAFSSFPYPAWFHFFKKWKSYHKISLKTTKKHTLLKFSFEFLPLFEYYPFDFLFWCSSWMTVIIFLLCCTDRPFLSCPSTWELLNWYIVWSLVKLRLKLLCNQVAIKCAW